MYFTVLQTLDLVLRYDDGLKERYSPSGRLHDLIRFNVLYNCAFERKDLRPWHPALEDTEI